MSQLSICLLGSFRVCLAGQSITGFSSNKTRALLAYLAVEAKQSHARVRLADLFWPDWPERTARAYLRQSLADLRRNLRDNAASPPYFLPDHHSVQFNPASRYTLDVSDLSQALSAALINPARDPDSPWLASLERAATAYAGDFLDGLIVNGCYAFDEWQLHVREQCRRNVVDAFHILSEFYAQQAKYPRALLYARRHSELEPLSEEAHRHLLRLLLRTGQRHTALEEHAVFARRLRDDLGVEPTRETEELVAKMRADLQYPQEILASTDQPSRATPFLPLAPTPLVGRCRDVAALVALFGGPAVRLITLTGPAGVGKSRLALAVADALRADFVDGVALVSLDTLTTSHSVEDEVARALGLSNRWEIAGYCQGRRMLLVLHNFEHLMEARRLLSDLLVRCPNLYLLVTSREVLHLQAEHVFPVAPLDTPDELGGISAQELAAFPAVALFVQRAQAARPDFALSQRNAQSVAEICSQLDGLPLAIELAAARCALLPTQALLDRLEDRFQLLRGGAQDVPDRHRTLHRAIGWSYDLLSPEEQTLFRRMAFFTEGCTLEEVAAVCTPQQELGLNPLEGVASLLDKSLIRRNAEQQRSGVREPRYGMLKSIRAFGLEKLRAQNEVSLLRCRYSRYTSSPSVSAVD